MRHLSLFLLIPVFLAAWFLTPAAVTFAGFTDTPTPTNTAVPTDTPTPTDTPVTPPATNTPVTPPATNTPVTPPATSTPVTPPATSTPPPPSDNPSPTPATDRRPLTDFNFGKSASPAQVQPGGRIDYTLNAANTGPVTALNVRVTDPLPAEVEYLSASASQGSSAYDAGAHTVTFNLGDIGAGQGASLSIRVRLRANVKAPLALINTAELTFDNANGSNGSGSSGGATSSVLAANASLIITDANGTPQLVSNQSIVRVLPNALPLTGAAPEVNWGLTLLLAALALAAPLWLTRRRPPAE